MRLIPVEGETNQRSDRKESVMKKSASFVLSVLLISQMVGVATAQDSLKVRMLGEVHHFVQQSHDVAMSGHYAFIASGVASGLRVLDLSDPAAPVEVGCAINTDTCPGVEAWCAEKVRVSGDHAYVLYYDGTWAGANYRLYVYDVSDPDRPRQMGYSCLPDLCTGLFVGEDYAYITACNFNFSGVKIVDVSDPMQPLVIGTFQTQGMPQSICVTDHIAYVADNNALVVYDVADPKFPEELGRYTPEGDMALIHHVSVHGRYVYIIDSLFGIRILDASDCSRIEEVASIPHNLPEAYFSPMIVSGDLLYYMRNTDFSSNTLVILDMSEPTAPVEIGSHVMSGSMWFTGFDYDEGYACIAAVSSGLKVVDVSNPGSIEEVGCYKPHALAFGLARADDYAFISISAEDENLLVYDVSDPSSPTEVHSLSIEGRPFWTSVWENYLFVPGVEVDQLASVGVLNISDRINPTQIACWQPVHEYSGVPLSVERYGNYAFVALAYGGVQVYDVTRIDQPTALDNWTLFDPITNQGFAVRCVKVSWPYLFVPEEVYGLYVLDVSDPANITVAASHPTPGSAWWIDISPDGDYVYVADFSGGLRIFDVSNPSVPVEVGSYTKNLERATQVTVKGDSVYVSDSGEIGLHVIDVSDPAAPLEVAYHRTPGAHAQGITVADDRIYLIEMTHFEIFEMIQEPSGMDSDGDGVIDGEDNCPYVYNPDQAPVDRGDIDCEGGINILDMLNVVNHILSTVPLVGAPLERADCNGDAQIDVLDVIGMANVILGYIPECPGNRCRPEITPEVLDFFKSLQPYLSAEDFVRFMALVHAELLRPAGYHLWQSYPNPFNPETNIDYTVPVDCTVKLEVYNTLGQKVATLVHAYKSAGRYTVHWNAADVPAGVYFYRLTAGGASRNESGEFSVTRKMILMK
jgi:hypothetical protein